ncbi:hypothetical protein BDZ91DRAFT_730754 [Kalaharituber pfeilii]|nr:hypothetical protein BDZ91DRAFT_730754 [Kalaharituber pfeilii]
MRRKVYLLALYLGSSLVYLSTISWKFQASFISFNPSYTYVFPFDCPLHFRFGSFTIFPFLGSSTTFPF